MVGIKIVGLKLAFW